jgi:hypothetical protein
MENWGEPLNSNATVSLALCAVAPILMTYAVLLPPTDDAWLVPLLVACVLCPLGAAFFGHAAKRELKTGATVGKAVRVMAAAGLTIGYLELVFVVLTALSPPFHPSRIAADQSIAVGSLRSLNFAAHVFAAAHPEKGFPKILADLHWNGSQPQPDWTVDAALESGMKMRYRFIYVAKTSNRGSVVDAYQVFADPLDLTNKELRHFFTDQSEVIRFAFGAPASQSSDALQ